MSHKKSAFVIRIDKGNKLRFEDIALILFFSGNAIVYLVGKAFSLIGLGSLSSIGMMAVHAVTVVGLLLGLLKQEKSFLGKNIAFLIFLLMLIIVNYFLNPGIGVWLRNDTYGLSKVFALEGHIFAGGIIAYYIVIIHKDPDRIMKNLKISNI